ncbi:unnamed protein product [Rotaria sordida]|uniref:Uncharacterized protein n=1 Tax=Rotaria sordida TaxID=392033 RepID=A0A819G2T0_9BILA|nr:unnamed protein product [Rotaria sordida]CAF3873184.1 unnamed protein product [Rotaria sordida]
MHRFVDAIVNVLVESDRLKKQLQLFAQLCKNENKQKNGIEEFTGDIYEKGILDLYSSCEFSFEQYLQMLPSLRIRQ